MAVTGTILVLFVLGHLAGNLLVFQGRTPMNAYGALLKSQGVLLWGVRGVLLACVVAHIVAAVQLTRQSHASRPVDYVRWRPQASTFASRTIRWGGALLAVFIVFHLLHFTTGTLHPNFRESDVYGNLVSGLRVWYVAAFYLVAMGALGLHFYHGVWSFLRTLGLTLPSATPFQRRLATALALVVWLGFSSIPLAVLLGVLA